MRASSMMTTRTASLGWSLYVSFLVLSGVGTAWTTPSYYRCRYRAPSSLASLPNNNNNNKEQDGSDLLSDNADSSTESGGGELAVNNNNNNNGRGKVNEIDFCMAPADVSLSRSGLRKKQRNNGVVVVKDGGGGGDKNSDDATVSLTRALNNASNRAVRRILLARSWPSAEALNLSLRRVLSSDPASSLSTSSSVPTLEDDLDDARCPVPRPILNAIMRRRGDVNSIDDDDTPPDNVNTSSSSGSGSGGSSTPTRKSGKRGRSDDEWVVDQLDAFGATYGDVAGYGAAEDYLACILQLATTGAESDKVDEVLAGGVYDESYRRLKSVLQSVGTVFEDVEPGSTLTKIAPKLIDQDICLSVMDKISIQKEKANANNNNNNNNVEEMALLSSTAEKALIIEEKEDEIVAPGENNKPEAMTEEAPEGKRKFPFFFMSRKKSTDDDIAMVAAADDDSSSPLTVDNGEQDAAPDIQPQDLGSVLLSAEEPSMTRQLNILANIVRRALLFGGDQELLVLSETLAADKPAFVQRWYPDTTDEADRPGVQFLSCLVLLLEDCYADGVVQDLNPPLPLAQSSYRNAYERLTAGLVQQGSGYVRPSSGAYKDRILGTVPKTPREEFGRFAEWEVNIRQISPDVTAYPDDLVGEWEVRDEVGGKTIGVSTVSLAEQGKVKLRDLPSLQGLRWRLDPGPTHLDTCTFQVLSDDGAVLQYKGFIDRGARLESRFSKRPIQIRGAVTFQMRDGEAAMMSEGYKKDMLPIDYNKMGTTRFIMTKSVKSKPES